MEDSILSESDPNVEEPELNESNVSIGNAVESQESQEEAEEETPQEEQREKLVKIPLGRVRHIVKLDPDVHLINQEALFLITKSTELFIDSLAKEAYKHTLQAKKKTVQMRDVKYAIDDVDALVFLEGTMDS